MKSRIVLTHATALLALFSLLAPVVPAHAGSLADSPLSLKGSVPPNVMFSLSVEFPTAVQRAYSGLSDYAAASEYLGLFDQNKCYTYDTVNGWFAPSGMATSHACSGDWSGNFLNWATMTGLDEFRYAMTGGNRYVDTATTTVLERSYIDTHGSTGYFGNKSYSGTGAAPYPSLTVANAQKGVQMTVTAAGTDTLNCASPVAASPYCTLSVASNSDAVTCSTWAGAGTDGSDPYRCTSLGAGLPAGATATAAAATSFTTSPVADTVTCASPDYTGAFSCTLALTGTSSAGACDTWAGSGTSSGDPFRCSDFGTFGANDFTAASYDAALSFTEIVTTTTSTRVPTSGTSAITCTISSGSTSSRSISCPLGGAHGGSATSSNDSRSGIYYSFSSFAITSPGGTVLTAAVDTSGPTATCGTSGSTQRYCYTRYNISYNWNAPSTTTSTYYYAPSYSGTRGATRWYVPSYALSFGGSTTLNVRVKVCDATLGLESNCKAYGSSYKPTGVLHDYGDKMRFGVFSYYNSNDIDNAVMRSKAKYVAPQKYSPDGGTAANSATEWSSTDGTLVADPDPAERTSSYPSGSNPSRSGVINYINKFGRPTDPLPGSTASTYKTYDPVGKLYYETLKYLRGLAPSTQLYTNASAANNDNFPVITTWDDPLQYSCQKNYIIALGDKNTHCDKRLPGGTIPSGSVGSSQCSAGSEADDYGSFAETIPANSGPAVNVATWTNALGNLQGDSPDTRAASRTGAGSNGSWYMSGLAYWAASQDIRLDDPTRLWTLGKQTVRTFVIDVEEGGASSTSQFAMAAKYGGAKEFDATGAPLNSVYVNTPTTDDNYLAGFPSYPWPKNLLRASDPAKMIAAVRSALSAIDAQRGDESALAQSSGSLNTGTGAYIYRATYNSERWSGSVDAFTIDSTGTISATAQWSAGTLFDTASAVCSTRAAACTAAADRTILTFNDGRTSAAAVEVTANARRGVVFSSAAFANLSTGQQARLNSDDGGATDGRGTARVDYLRGVRDNEAPNGFGWRTRSGVLGDNISSNPLYVSTPKPFQPGRGYASFTSTWRNRSPMLYVGGNDGMLHGFDATYSIAADGTPTMTTTSGKERIGYVPSAVYQNLNRLMSNNYSHKYFVDGSPVVAEAYFGNSCSVDADTNHPELCWKSLLVGGLNAGGQGIYALDVTDPSSFSASKVLWEFTDADDADMGFTFGKPIIRRINFASGGVAKDRWAVIFGNGYNNTEADSFSSTTGRAHLFVLLVDGPGNGNAWVQGTNYWKIPLKSPSEGASPSLPLATPNGLSSVTALDSIASHVVETGSGASVTVEQPGTVDLIYAGDRFGNVWKIDLSSNDPADWGAAFGTAADPLPLFTTSDGAATPAAQKITTSLEIQPHPNGGYMVLFGTGSWIETTDPLTPFKTDTFYGIWDKNDGATRVTSRSSLQPQKVLANVDATGTACTAGVAGCYAILSNCAVNYDAAASAASNLTTTCPAAVASPSGTTQRLGWTFDLPGSGERTFSDRPSIDGDNVTFTTLQPASDPCTGNTTGLEYTADFLNGSPAAKPVYIVPTNDVPGKITVIINGVSVSAAISGVTISGGAADTGIKFTATPPSTNSTATLICGSSTGFPSAPCATEAACEAINPAARLVPGWGFAWNRVGGTSGAKQCVVDCKPAQVGEALSCTWKVNSEKSGRFSWRQIVR